MKTLLLKDFYNLSKTSKTMVIVMLAYGIFGIVSGEASVLTGLIAVFCAIIPISSFSYDDFAKWDIYVQSMPISRRMIVLEKYVLGVILILIGSAVTLLFSILSAVINSTEIDFAEILASTGLVSLLCLLMQAVVLPIVIKLGVERGRIAMFAVFFIPAILIMLLAKMPPAWVLDLDFEALIESLTVAAPIVCIVLAVLSYFLSLKLYVAKEF